MKKIIILLLLSFCIGNIGLAQVLCDIDSELQQLIEQKNGDLISINIILKSQIDVDKLTTRSQDFNNRAAKKDAVLKEFKRFSETSQSDVLAVLQAETRSNNVRNIKSHWITNMINCEASGDVIYQIAKHPDVEAIIYNKKEYMLFDEKPMKVDAVRGMVENISKINADDVWSYGYTGKGVVVSVLDTGVNTEHVDLKDHLWDGGEEYPNHGYNTLDDSHDIIDRQGHGTHCAGTICGDGTSGTQTGMAPDATLMCVKVLGDNGEGTLDAIIKGVEFSVENGADLLSLSLGASFSNTYTNEIYRLSFENLLEFDVLAVVAAGNDRDKLDEYPMPRNISSPGNCPPAWIHPDQQANMGGTSSIVCVGAVDYSDNSAYFSSEGPATWSGTLWNDYILDMSSDLAPGWLDYDNGEFAAGITINPSFKWGVMFPPSKLKKYENGELTKVAMYDCVAHAGEIEIYQGGNTPNEGVLVHSQAFACSGSNSFVEFDLTTPLAIDNTENLWVVLSTDDGGTVKPAAACNSIHDPNGRWIGMTYNDYTTWYDACEWFELKNTWMIRAFVSDDNGEVAALSSEENNEFGIIRPDVCAPGVNIVSCAFDSNDGLIAYSGTSMATPCVAGAVALLLEKNPYLTPAAICEALETTAVKLSDKKSNHTGSGRIDIAAAIEFFGEEEKPIISMQPINNVKITANENSSILVSLNNIGSAPTHDITLELSTDDPNVSIVNATANFGVIQPGNKMSKAFIVKAKASVPDGHDVNFKLTDVSQGPSLGSITYTFNEGLDGWTTIDANNDNHTWYHSSQVSDHNTPESKSDCFVISESYCNALGQAISPNDYLVSPLKIAVNEETTIEFNAQAQDANFPAEHFGIAVSTTGNNSESCFSTVYEFDMMAKSPGGWYKCSESLAQYKGQEIWVAIRHFNCHDQFRLNIDNIVINNYTKENEDAWKASFSATVSNECLAPSNLTATALDESSIQLSWEASATAKEYQILRDNKMITTVKTTSYTDKKLDDNTKYCYIVKSVCDAGTSEPSNEACATTEKTPCVKPEELEAEAIDAYSISLSWEDMSCADSYKVYRDGSFLESVDDNKYVDTDLDPDTEYCYTVKSVCGEELSKNSEEVCVETLDGENISDIRSSFNVFPNPVEDQLVIETKLEIKNVSIYDTFGRLMMINDGQQTIIDVSGFNGGVYFVKIMTDNGEVTKLFIKK